LLPDGRYRATVGTLFEFQELCRTGDLESLLRQLASAEVVEFVGERRAEATVGESGAGAPLG
jgi:hypothetical protein